MNKYQPVFNVVIVLLLIGVLLQNTCSTKITSNDRDTVSVTHHYYDSSRKEILVKQPIIYKEYYNQPDSGTDTLFVFMDYHMRRYYNDTLSDSNMVAYLETVVENNKLKDRKFSYKWLKPVTINTTTILPAEKKRLKVFIGGHAGVSSLGIKSLAPGAAILTKNDLLFTGQFNILDQSIQVGMLWKVRMNKR